MSSPNEAGNRNKNRNKRSAKKRPLDANHGRLRQSPPIPFQVDDINSPVDDVINRDNGHQITTNGNNYDSHRSKLAQRIAELIQNQEPEENSLDIITVLVDESNKEYEREVEMLREEVQNLKRMLHDATGILQQMPKEHSQGNGIKDAKAVSPAENGDFETRLQRELQRQRKRMQEDFKRDMDKLRLYFEKQCSQGQADYIKEIYALKMECNDLQQLRAEMTKLNEICDEKSKRIKHVEVENGEIMRENIHLAESLRQQQTTLMKMEKDKLASEERTKKILLAVREGLHKLSDMRDDVPAESGLTTFYNHVEEIITTDDWGDDDVYTKGVMEEIQVSVQKLSKSSSEKVIFEPKEQILKSSSESQTDFPPTIPAAEVDEIKAGYEAKMTVLEDNFALEKKSFEQTLNDFRQRLEKMTRKSQSDRKFIEELSVERETEREELLKVTKNLENAWREQEKLTERIRNLQLANEETENQLRIISAQNDVLETLKKRLHDDLQVKNDLLQQKTDVITELERQLMEKVSQETSHQRQLERLKLELSGFLHSPPASPEPDFDTSFTFDDLRKQIMDLKDELEARNRQNETEREQRVHVLRDELDKARKSEQRAVRDRETLEQQISSLELDVAVLRQQLEVAKFSQPDEDLVENLNGRIAYLQSELESCQRIIGEQDVNLQNYREEMESMERTHEHIVQEFERKNAERLATVRNDLMKQMELFEEKNNSLVRQIEETSRIWEEQQKIWENDMARKSEEVLALKKEIAESRDLSNDLDDIRTEMDELRSRLEDAEKVAKEKSAHAESLKNLVDIMKSEAVTKDTAMRALRKQLNDNSTGLARQLEEIHRSNTSLQEEVDRLRNAPDRSAEKYESLLRDKDSEISNLRDLLDASMDESLKTGEQPELFEISVQTDRDDHPPVSRETFQTSSDAVQKTLIESDAQTDYADDIQYLLTQITDLRATIRELEHSVAQKDNQLEAMAVELASLHDRHGKTQTKHRATIRYLNQSRSSSSEEEPEGSPMNGHSKSLVRKYEDRIKEMEKVHADELERLVQESLAVLHNSSMQLSPNPNASTREISPGSISIASLDDSTLLEGHLSDNLQKALRELRNGSEAILKASEKLHPPVAEGNGISEHWPAERELLLGKVSFFRETINTVVLSRDAMEKALRHLEQQNEELQEQLEMLKKEDQMADEGKDLLLSLLKKTESELAELQARYRQRDLRIEIEQAGREREEREREKLQKELRDAEVQLVRIRGELRQKEAQWERERILNMWRKDVNAMEESEVKSAWKGKYIRAESYRKNLTHQKRYLITLIDDIILNTTDDFARKLALDGVRPTIIRGSTSADRLRERKRPRFRCAVVVVCAMIRLQNTKNKWQRLRSVN